MQKITLHNFKGGEDIEFECIDHETEKSFYKFYLSTTEIKYVPMYDFILDIKFPFEFKIPDRNDI